jgi:peroxin-1
MEACSRKIALDSTVDLKNYADQTAGFSGADLQALIYNAHLDAIHATLSNLPELGDSASSNNVEEKELSYTSFGGTEKDEKVLSRAEQASVTKRVSSFLLGLTSDNILSRITKTNYSSWS